MIGSSYSGGYNLAAVRSDVAANWGWYLALGIISLIAGILAIAFPLIASIAVKILIGWLLILIGISQILQAFQTQRWRGAIVDFLLGALLFAAGCVLAFLPLTGLITLTLFLAIVFIVQGIFQIAISLQLRPIDGWGWLMFGGIIALGVGVLLALELPSSASWALGLLAGVNMIASGISYIALALTAKRLADSGR
ncbi:Hded protein [Candidatus Filomicrobium marinum]|nr:MULTISPECIES: HdeD family acid-resistance protein [Filomicrobium]MCV0368544.1 HdeD family acid-resistance protein [Filomicrobium sp.]CFX01891.1 Hded protein [Candidatus Filomicrobium marinum]SDO63206.1 Uncharacterized membrane protein HdeD, DUF308 family [Filomicrobium insigne]